MDKGVTSTWQVDVNLLDVLQTLKWLCTLLLNYATSWLETLLEVRPFKVALFYEQAVFNFYQKDFKHGNDRILEV